MRVNRGRLDLGSLTLNAACTITTGVSSIKLTHTASSIDMGIYLKGVGGLVLTSDRLTSVEHESGKNAPTRWLHLDALAPKRLYVLQVTRREEDGRVEGWYLKDATPETRTSYQTQNSGGLVRKLFRRDKGRGK